MQRDTHVSLIYITLCKLIFEQISLAISICFQIFLLYFMCQRETFIRVHFNF